MKNSAWAEHVLGQGNCGFWKDMNNSEDSMKQGAILCSTKCSSPFHSVWKCHNTLHIHKYFKTETFKVPHALSFHCNSTLGAFSTFWISNPWKWAHCPSRSPLIMSLSRFHLRTQTRIKVREFTQVPLVQSTQSKAIHSICPNQSPCALSAQTNQLHAIPITMCSITSTISLFYAFMRHPKRINTFRDL